VPVPLDAISEFCPRSFSSSCRFCSSFRLCSSSRFFPLSRTSPRSRVLTSFSLPVSGGLQQPGFLPRPRLREPLLHPAPLKSEPFDRGPLQLAPSNSTRAFFLPELPVLRLCFLNLLEGGTQLCFVSFSFRMLLLLSVINRVVCRVWRRYLGILPITNLGATEAAPLAPHLCSYPDPILESRTRASEDFFCASSVVFSPPFD